VIVLEEGIEQLDEVKALGDQVAHDREDEQAGFDADDIGGGCKEERLLEVDAALIFGGQLCRVVAVDGVVEHVDDEEGQ